MSQYFPKPPSSHRENIKMEVDLSNYATKADIKNITHVDTPSFALKTNLANLKTEVDKLDVGKLVTVPIDLSKLSNVVKNDVVKKTEYDKLVGNVNNIDSSDFVLKTKYSTNKTELENKIPGISNLATKTALTTVENKIPNVSNLVKKTDYNTEVTEIEKKLTDHKHDEYIDTSEFNTLATNVFNARKAQANLITKTDFDAKLLSLNRKVTKNKTDHLLFKNELDKLKTFDSGYFNGQSHIEEDGTQNYLLFQTLKKYFKIITNAGTKYISSWQSKGLSYEIIKAPVTSNYKLNPKISYYGTKARLEFRRSCFKQDKSTFNHGKILNIYMVDKLDKLYNKTHPNLVNCLFGAVNIIKNADIDKNKYLGHGIGFVRISIYSVGNGFGRNVIIFGADMSSSIHIDNKKKTF